MLEFRPHHFLCTLGFRGRGYSKEFVRQYQEVADSLKNTPTGDETLIRVTDQTDSICNFCPNRSQNSCNTEEKIQKLDEGHAKVLGIKTGDILSWHRAKALLASKMTDSDFEDACAPCSWRQLGVCKSALINLRSSLRSSTTSWIALGFGMLFLLSAKPSVAQPVTTPEPLPVDFIKLQLFEANRPLVPNNLKRASVALNAKKFQLAQKLASTLKGDESFSDYGLAISALAYRGEAELLCSARKYQQSRLKAQRALEFFAQIEATQPYSPFIKRLAEELARTEIAIAKAFFLEKKQDKSMLAFERALQRLSTSGQLGILTPEDLEHYSEGCSKKETTLCSSWIHKLALTYPKSSNEWKALTKSTPKPDLNLRSNPSFSKLTQSYKAPDLDQTAFDSAIKLLLNKKTKDAIRSFERFIDEFPRSAQRFRARFWLARALSDYEEPERARSIYFEIARDSPLTYYGLLSATALGIRPESAISADLPLAIRQDRALQPLEAYRLRRAELFLASGLKEFAALELKDLRSKENFSNPFLVYLATLHHETENHLGAFAVAGELAQRGYKEIYSSYGLRLIFPISYFNLIEKYAELNKLDPILVISLIKQESSFEAQATSSAGATGLTQLMLATAVDTDPQVKRAALLDAETNVRIGTRYLRQMLDNFNENTVLALAAYNAGPGAVERWVRDARVKDLGMLEFIESIPYRETREYVSSILRNYFWYSRKINGDATKNLADFWRDPPKP